MEYMILKDKVAGFLEDGHCEVYDVEQAKLLVELFSSEGHTFNMRYKNSMLGEFWYFKKE